jgi:glucosamine--fructose-6-phosphate aminotransferase (isomerizing)
MCGIFGYVGEKQVAPILLDGLRTLEYRGYDSAGIYVPGHDPIKAVGEIANLTSKVPSDLMGTTGIAHTRWATHGPPTEINAHPHQDSLKNITIVHNGIIENFRELKANLEQQGHVCDSATDTEVLAKLIGSLYVDDLLLAVRQALLLVRGTYGLLVCSADVPEQIIVARMGSPVVLGLAATGNLVSSDPSALLSHTKEVVYLEDGDIAVVTADAYVIDTSASSDSNRASEKIEWDIESIQKQGFAHFMLKEIHEAPDVIRNTIRGRILTEEGNVKLGGLESVLDQINELDRLVIVGCGSAYYAAQAGRYMLEEYAGIPVEVELGSEYRYKKNMQTGKSAVLAVTQSGETADTLASVRKAKDAGLLTLGIVNTVGSTIARETDAGVHNHAGPEIAVASTKAFLSQLTVFVLLTVLIGREKGTLSQVAAVAILSELEELPVVIETYLKKMENIDAIAAAYATYSHAMFIGRKFHAPIAYEGSLKLKECTYIHAEAYAGGELKHGSIALLDEQFPVIALAPQDDVYEKMISNMEEAKARLAPILAIATEGDSDITAVTDDVLYVPKVYPILQPIVTTIPLHLLAYKIGVAKGINVDRPRNLAKSVTVE